MGRIPTDPFEIATNEYLRRLRDGEVTFEPNGARTFPDFQVGKSVIVETTRLEKTIETGDGDRRHHSTVYVPFVHSMERAIEKCPAPSGAHDWFISIRVSFPQDSRAVARRLKSFLREISANPIREPGKSFSLTDGVDVGVARGDASDNPQFYLGSVNPSDLSGWVVSDTIDQINDAIQRKGEVLEEYSFTYDEAWLAVGGGSSLGVTELHIPDILEGLVTAAGWQRVVLLRLDDPGRSLVFDL